MRTVSVWSGPHPLTGKTEGMAYHHHNYQRGMEEKLERNLVFLKSSCILILILFGWSKVSLEKGRGGGQREEEQGGGGGFSGLGGEVEAYSCGSGGQLEPLKLQNDGWLGIPATYSTQKNEEKKMQIFKPN